MAERRIVYLVALVGSIIFYLLYQKWLSWVVLMAVLSDEGKPVRLRWLTALCYFYEGPIPPELEPEAMEYLSDFLSCGEPGTAGPKLLDWERDAPEIIA